MHGLQEKFQTIVPGRVEQGESWVSFESQRDTRGLKGFSPKNAVDVDLSTALADTPPGMEMSNQRSSQQDNMPLSMAGATDVSDCTTTGFANGFKKLEMKGTDDCYTGEHVDHFYGDAGGFAERNNYLDRI